MALPARIAVGIAKASLFQRGHATWSMTSSNRGPLVHFALLLDPNLLESLHKGGIVGRKLQAHLLHVECVRRDAQVCGPVDVARAGPPKQRAACRVNVGAGEVRGVQRREAHAFGARGGPRVEQRPRACAGFSKCARAEVLVPPTNLSRLCTEGVIDTALLRLSLPNDTHIKNN